MKKGRPMTEKQIVVHYGELSTKGRNRKSFQNKIAEQIRYRTQSLERVKVLPEHDFMYVSWQETDYESMVEVLKDIPGIAYFEPVYQVDKEIQAIKAKAVDLFSSLKIQPGQTFRIIAKRQDKTFPLETYDIQRELGRTLGLAFPDLKVDLKHADYSLRVQIAQKDAAFLSLNRYPGLQGMPYGSSGRGMLMLSGGFDSPIAGYLMMKRGMEIEAVHFSSPPYTSPQALEKAKKLTAKLAHYGMPIKFHNVPFAHIQEEIKASVYDNESMTVMRRIMLRIMDQLLVKSKADAIINGESLGQVASQTIKSMRVINAVTHTPILRPLIATDKNDIIALAEKIGTYDISNEPYEDCCTVFAPTSPHTRPKQKTIEELESRLDLRMLIEEAVQGVETQVIGEDYLEAKQADFKDLL